MKDEILKSIPRCGWAIGTVIEYINDAPFKSEIYASVKSFQDDLKKQQKADSPYGVPYKPNIWGAGWNIQRFGVDQYFYHKGWPELVPTEFFEHALNFILGVHPGPNNASFISGGVVSGTALIRPDFPELKTWPFFWRLTICTIKLCS
jgi:hypothetical protein